jgi:hypothetical protein
MNVEQLGGVLAELLDDTSAVDYIGVVNIGEQFVEIPGAKSISPSQRTIKLPPPRPSTLPGNSGTRSAPSRDGIPNIHSISEAARQQVPKGA